MGYRHLLCLTSLLWLSPGLSLAEENTYPTESHTAIRNQVQQFITEQLSQPTEGRLLIRVGELDSRLQLHQCNRPLEVYSPSNTPLKSNTTVGVRCTSNTPWSIFIPVKISTYLPVLVANHPLAQGAYLTANDFRTEERELSQLGGGYITQPEQILNKVVRSPIPATMPITLRQLSSPLVIHRGENISIVAEAGNIRVQISGVAMDDGHLGDTIKIKNTVSNRIIEASVTGSGKARIAL